MKAEIKFNVFLDKCLMKFMAENPETFTAFLAAMDAVSLVQRYCFVYRARKQIRGTASGRALEEVLKRCCQGLGLEECSTKEHTVQLAIDKTSRVQYVIHGPVGGSIKVDVLFFQPGDTEEILRIFLGWHVQDGQVIHEALWMAVSGKLNTLYLASV